MFSQIPKCGGQELHRSGCAIWIGGLCGLYICCSELGRELVEPPRKGGNFLYKLSVLAGVCVQTLPSPHLGTLCRSNCSPVLLESRARWKGQ